MNMMLWILIAVLVLFILCFAGFWLFMAPRRRGTRVVPEGGGATRVKDDIWQAASRSSRDYR